MCIRDSLDAGAAHSHRLHDSDLPACLVVVTLHGGLDAQQLAVMAHVARAVACLLYTSDAADERSSVDLGGRRIIKKKKKKKQRL